MVSPAEFITGDILCPRHPNGYFLATTGAVRGIAYNTNLVPPDKAPKKWEDCLDPMWRGKVLYDPRPKLTSLGRL